MTKNFLSLPIHHTNFYFLWKIIETHHLMYNNSMTSSLNLTGLKYLVQSFSLNSQLYFCGGQRMQGYNLVQVCEESDRLMWLQSEQWIPTLLYLYIGDVGYLVVSFVTKAVDIGGNVVGNLDILIVLTHKSNAPFWLIFNDQFVLIRIVNFSNYLLLGSNA